MKPHFLLIAFSYSLAIGQSIAWTKRIGNSDYQAIHRIRSGKDGSVFLFGRFKTYPLENGENRKSFGGEDLFIHKLDSIGNTVWFRNVGSDLNSDYPIDMDVDSVGNLFVAGDLAWNLGVSDNFRFLSADNDTIRLDNKEAGYAFVAKYNPSGKVLWTKQFQKSCEPRLKQVLVGYGKVILVGDFYGRARYFGESDSVTSNGYASFLSELNGDGSVQSLNTIDSAIAILVVREDKNKNRYFGLVNAVDEFRIEKKLPDGKTAWKRKLQSSIDGRRMSIVEVACDSNNEVYVSGNFNSGSKFRLDNGQDTVLYSIHSSDMYLLKMDSAGKTLWLNAWTTDYLSPSNITFTPDQSLHLLGKGGVWNYKSNTNGKMTWSFKTGGGLTGNECGTAIGASGKMLYAITFSDTITILGSAFKSAGYQDVLLYALDPITTATTKSIRSNATDFRRIIEIQNKRFYPDGRYRKTENKGIPFTNK